MALFDAMVLYNPILQGKKRQKDLHRHFLQQKDKQQYVDVYVAGLAQISHHVIIYVCKLCKCTFRPWGKTFSKTEIKFISMIFKSFKIKLVRSAPHC